MTIENFIKLSSMNVNDKIEKRKGDGGKELSYLSWSFAWNEFKKVYPDATYEIKKFDNGDGRLVPYMHDANTGYMVMTEVFADGLAYEMWLPVMNSSNKAMKSAQYEYTTKYGTKTVEAANMFDINKTIMRCLVKNLAMFGLGLYIYAGEDLPEAPDSTITTTSTVNNETFDTKEIKDMIAKCESTKELKEIWVNYKDVINKDTSIFKLINDKGVELSSKVA